MRSLRSKEGYLEVDPGAGPAISLEDAAKFGRPVMGAGVNRRMESSVATCAHCQVQVLLNPLRTRDRNFCRKCYAYVCDNPGCLSECRPWAKLLDKAERKILKEIAIDKMMIPNMLGAMRVGAERSYDISLKRLIAWDQEGALKAIDAALAIYPNEPKFRLHRGIILLFGDRWEEGWRDKEGGYAMRAHGFPDMPPELKWDGSPGKDVVLLAEDGAGDEIMMLRYLPWAIERSKTVRLLCHGGMAELMRDYPGLDVQTAVTDAQLSWAYTGSLPMLHGTTRENIPPPLPHLRDAALMTDCVLPGTGRKKVGICWAGAKSTFHDAHRSMRLEDMEVLADLDCDFYSFQVGGKVGDGIFDLGPALTDWRKTAALLARMDVVVSVDTAVAHLAASIGVETHMLASRFPVWQWPVDRRDSPWYPAMTIHWQEFLGDWSTPIAEVATVLEGAPEPKREVYLPSLIERQHLDTMAEIASACPPGAFVEVGVYKGGSAKVLYRIAQEQERALHLYDTFEGHPLDEPTQPKGRFADTDWRQIAAAMPEASVFVGRFPETFEPIAPIAFVHCDVDQYQSSLDVCETLWPLLAPGGAILVDDYNVTDCPGCRRAIDEFAGRNGLAIIRPDAKRALLRKAVA